MSQFSLRTAAETPWQDSSSKYHFYRELQNEYGGVFSGHYWNNLVVHHDGKSQTKQAIPVNCLNTSPVH
ncbi:hypothetical protein VTI28DRAFT_1111 [Corynascus sepedonium]